MLVVHHLHVDVDAMLSYPKKILDLLNLLKIDGKFNERKYTNNKNKRCSYLLLSMCLKTFLKKEMVFI